MSPGKTILIPQNILSSLYWWFHYSSRSKFSPADFIIQSVYCSRFGRMGHVSTNGKPQKRWKWNINLFTHFDRSNSIRSSHCDILDKEVSIDVKTRIIKSYLVRFDQSKEIRMHMSKVFWQQDETVFGSDILAHKTSCYTKCTRVFISKFVSFSLHLFQIIPYAI